MRKLLLSSVALASMSAAAFAADLPRREAAPAPAPIYAAPIFTWTGFYVGLNAGVAFGGDRGNLGIIATGDQSTYYSTEYNRYYGALGRNDDNNTAFTGGVQAGYNWQFGAMVLGIETDINYRGHSNNDSFGFAIPSTGYSFAYNGDKGGNWFGTLRPRIGFAMDRTLLYVTGGLAYGKTGGGGSAYVYETATGIPLNGYSWGSSNSGTNWGWTLGAGVEHAFSNNWTAKLEYLYVDLDKGDKTLVGPVGTPITFVNDRKDTFSVVRVGLNYKFGGPAYGASPVLARY
ncbi:MAG: porin family protein [Hyphomicrobiales bacterium]|nr:porin family protein [Hyphomicrobiales bacterium]